MYKNEHLFNNVSCIKDVPYADFDDVQNIGINRNPLGVYPLGVYPILESEAVPDVQKSDYSKETYYSPEDFVEKPFNYGDLGALDMDIRVRYNLELFLIQL